ncbi:hypothetical protein HYV71_01245, partial [Candidatus Uhrbacteria bacterium]|nr:hypothetical protein [Candidatus Uhrbacteria bacterium]
SYPENELGESRMEAIDNAIEIINTAEKERAEIAVSLDKTTDSAELRSLVGRSSEMALQSAAAAGRLEAFAKEMRGQASDESAAKVSEEAEQKLRAFYQEDPGGPHKSGLGIAFQKGEIIITHAVQGLGRGVLKKTTLSEADIRSALPDDLAVEIAETPLHKLKPELRAKVADAAADYFIKTMASGGFEKPAAPAAAGDTTTEAAGTHAKGSEGAEPEIGSVETHPNRMFVYFVFRAPDNTVTHSTLTLERPEILAALPEQIRDTIGDTPFNKLGQKTINEIKELITPLINAKIAEKIGLPTMTTTQAAESPQPVPAAGDEAAQGGDFMPEGTFDEGGHAPPDTLGQEESWVEQAKRQGFVCSGSSGYEDHVIANYYDLPPPHDGRGKLSIAVSQDQIMQVLPQDLQNKIAEEGGLFWADQNSEEQKTIFAAAEECAARKILRNMASEAAGLVEPPHPDLEGVNNTIDNLYSRAEDLFDADIMADLAFLGDIPPPNDEWARQLQDLRDRVATNQNMIAHWFDERDHVNTIQKTDAESTYILTRDCAQALAGWLEDREDLTFEIRRMANAQRETLPFLSPPASGGMNIDETAPFLGLEQAWTAPQTPGAPQLVAREPLQIGAGSETRQLTPQETARVQEIDQKVASLKARIAERDEQIRLIEEQIRALASQSNET